MRAALLYDHYHANREDEREELFALMRSEFSVERGLYPGCFVHLTPSFVIPWMVYADADSRARTFFSGPRAAELVAARKRYEEESQFIFHRQDYREPIPIEEESVDLLISQFAGPVGSHCLGYVKRGGYLLANDSHGDAGRAFCDERLALVGAVQRHGERFTLVTTRLDEYFVPRSSSVPAERSARLRYLENLDRGLPYRHVASDYVFVRS